MPGRQLALPAAAICALVASCANSSSGGQSAQTGAGSPPQVHACPSPPTSEDRFPPGPASRVPHPASASAPRALPVAVKGQSEVQFTTAMPLRDAAAFVQSEYAAAGYRIVDGDAEKNEADIVWAHGAARGKTRLSAAGPCATTWTVLSLPKGTSPTATADRD